MIKRLFFYLILTLSLSCGKDTIETETESTIDDEIIGQEEKEDENQPESDPEPLNFESGVSIYFTRNEQYNELIIDEYGEKKDSVNYTQDYNFNREEYWYYVDHKALTFYQHNYATTNQNPPSYWQKSHGQDVFDQSGALCDNLESNQNVQVVFSNTGDYGYLDFRESLDDTEPNKLFFKYSLQGFDCQELEMSTRLMQERAAVVGKIEGDFAIFRVITSSYLEVWNLKTKTLLKSFTDVGVNADILNNELVVFVYKPNSAERTYLVYDLTTGDLIRSAAIDLSISLEKPPQLWGSFKSLNYKALGKKVLVDYDYDIFGGAHEGVINRGPVIYNFETEMYEKGLDKFLVNVYNGLLEEYSEIKIAKNWRYEYDADIETGMVVVCFTIDDGERSILVYTNFDAQIQKIVELDLVPSQVVIKS